MSTTVTELVIDAKGNPAVMETLWPAVKRLIGMLACRHGECKRLYDLDDLMQSGYLALHDAVQGYDPEAGAEFTTYLGYHIRLRFAEVSGRRGTKTRPELDAVSLDIPLDGDTENTRLDLLADPESIHLYNDLAERIGNRQMYDAIVAEIRKLPEELHLALGMTLIQGRSVREAAELAGCEQSVMLRRQAKALRAVRSTRACRLIADDFRHVSLSRFRSTHTPQVEEEVFRRIGLWDRGC